MAALALLLAQDAGAAGIAAARPSLAAAVAKPRTDPAKLRDCERAWTAQRIRKGSHHAFIRACVRHG